MKIPIPPMIAQVIGLCHQSLSAAREYARSVATDPASHKAIQITFVHIAADCTSLIERMDRRIPKSSWEDYKEQVIQADPLMLENINRIYMAMLPEQRDMLEKVAEAILTKQFTLECS